MTLFQGSESDAFFSLSSPSRWPHFVVRFLIRVWSRKFLRSGRSSVVPFSLLLWWMVLIIRKKLTLTGPFNHPHSLLFDACVGSRVGGASFASPETLVPSQLPHLPGAPNACSSDQFFNHTLCLFVESCLDSPLMIISARIRSLPCRRLNAGNDYPPPLENPRDSLIYFGLFVPLF